MAKPTPHVERPGPAEFRDPMLRNEIRRAAVWMGLALVIAGVIVLAGPLLLIVGGLVFSVILDGGTRLLGRVLPIPRGWRLAIVVLAGFGFIGWVFYFAGTTLAAQAEELRAVVEVQLSRLMALAASLGLVPEGGTTTIASQLLGSIGRLTSWVGSAIGAFTSMLLIIVIASHRGRPRLYDRGLAWMLPLRHRHNSTHFESRRSTLRRLLFGRLVGMLFEAFSLHPAR